MKYVFMCYLNRSGSTFLSNELSKLREIFVCPEAEVLPFTFLKNDVNKLEDKELLVAQLLNNKKLKEWGIERKKLSEIVNSDGTSGSKFLETLTLHEKFDPDLHKMIIFKATSMLHLFPDLLRQNVNRDLKMIHVIRDGRAVYNSQKGSMGSLMGLPMEISPSAAGKKWSSYIKSSNDIRSNHRKIITEVKYENLIADRDAAIEELLDFLGVKERSSKDNDAMLEEYIPESQRHLHSKVSEDPDRKRVDAWKSGLTPSEISLFEAEASEELVRNNYELVSPEIGRFFKSISKMNYSVKENLHKSKKTFINLLTRLKRKLFSNLQMVS